MATLQRSARSFRRQGSSGLVWDDDLYADQSYEGGKSCEMDLKELRPCQSAKALYAGMDFGAATKLNDAALPPGYPQNMSSARTSPTRRVLPRSLSAAFSRPGSMIKLKPRKAGP